MEPSYLMHPAERHRERIERAWSHIDEFKLELGKWADGDPHRARTEHYPERGIYLIRTESLEPPPFRLGLAAGDAVHNLRAALDNVVSDFVRKGMRDAISFPVLMSGGRNDLIAERCIRFLPERVIDIIHSVQPYNAQPASRRLMWLYVLNELWNADKHRAPSLFAMIPTWARVSYSSSTAMDADELRIKVFPGPVQQGKVIARINTKQEIDPFVAIDVAFHGGVAEKLSGWETLVGLHYQVRQIFKAIFPNVPFDWDLPEWNVHLPPSVNP